MRLLTLAGLVFFSMTGLSVWPGVVALAADPSAIEAFVGSWKGQEGASSEDGLSAEVLSLEVRGDGDGFSLSWPDLSEGGKGGVDSIDASFSATDRPGVYEFAPQSGSLLTRMFASPDTGNPLKGETLLWARLDDAGLTVYSMKIDRNGELDLDHYSWTRMGDLLQLTFSKRTKSGDVALELQGDLVAAGQ